MTVERCDLGDVTLAVEVQGQGEPLDLPATIIVGENDTWLRPAADALASAITGAKLVVVPGAGHSPQKDDPQRWIEEVNQHMSRLS